MRSSSFCAASASPSPPLNHTHTLPLTDRYAAGQADVPRLGVDVQQLLPDVRQRGPKDGVRDELVDDHQDGHGVLGMGGGFLQEGVGLGVWGGLKRGSAGSLPLTEEFLDPARSTQPHSPLDPARSAYPRLLDPSTPRTPPHLLQHVGHVVVPQHREHVVGRVAHLG